MIIKEYNKINILQNILQNKNNHCFYFVIYFNIALKYKWVEILEIYEQ
jgi:hypothetical protein